MEPQVCYEASRPLGSSGTNLLRVFPGPELNKEKQRWVTVQRNKRLGHLGSAKTVSSFQSGRETLLFTAAFPLKIQHNTSLGHFNFNYSTFIVSLNVFSVSDYVFCFKAFILLQRYHFNVPDLMFLCF